MPYQLCLRHLPLLENSGGDAVVRINPPIRMSGKGVLEQVCLLLDGKHTPQQPFTFQAQMGAATCMFPMEHWL